MNLKIFSVFLFSTYIYCNVPLQSFQPFGLENGDIDLSTTVDHHNDLDDGSSPRLNLTIPFKLFGETYKSLWVNINGCVSFLTNISKYTPECKPLSTNLAMISPYWADVDLRSGNGAIYYR